MVSLIRRNKIDISLDDVERTTWYSVGASRKEGAGIRNMEKQGGMAMESVLLTIKWVVFYGFEIFVVAVVLGMSIVGLYRMLRSRAGESQIPTLAATDR